MKKRGLFVAMLLVFCLFLTTVFGYSFVNTASAKGISTAQQAEKLAKKLVKGARVIEVEKDDDDGRLVYEVQLVKGKKEYDLTYRVSDAKLLFYSWEIQSGYVKKGKGHIISQNKCKKLAKKQVSRGKVLNVKRDRSDGIDVYEVKMRKGSKKYDLKFHARTGKLLEYEWELY